MNKTYHGGCHCGAVGFECDLGLSGTTSKCNCLICTKTRFWKAIVRAGAFRLLRVENALTDYRFGRNAIDHYFCSRGAQIEVTGFTHRSAKGMSNWLR